MAVIPFYAGLANDDDRQFLLARRKAHIAYRDDMLTLQKEAKDREMARFFKACAAEGMKHYRAICFVIGQMIGDAPGDCMNAPASAGLEGYISHEFGIMDASRCS